MPRLEAQQALGQQGACGVPVARAIVLGARWLVGLMLCGQVPSRGQQLSRLTYFFRQLPTYRLHLGIGRRPLRQVLPLALEQFA